MHKKKKRLVKNKTGIKVLSLHDYFFYYELGIIAEYEDIK
jgi:hypothetical protein